MSTRARTGMCQSRPRLFQRYELWPPCCHLSIGHAGDHESANPEGDLWSTLTWPRLRMTPWMERGL